MKLYTQFLPTVWETGNPRFESTARRIRGQAAAWSSETSGRDEGAILRSRLSCRVRQGGHLRPQTSNRAELRAVIVALQFRFWPGEGWTKIVIATDSEYVLEGATSWIKGWVQNEWRTVWKTGQDEGSVECLLGWREDAATSRAKTKLGIWLIPCEWNAKADGWAKLVADKGVRPTTFVKPTGYLI
ncbi:hypothetical protein Asppvi_006317 [Aspergillus pseudoviridinutans]|uniref:ribonuclease H n=1 Tax=Aspergillus pseudoviridinutans TaxID=1517512 RepID=A0A9P3BGR4_9EURO|nr:uncharacterized protein Asppvi_006317 [Aspergillus pseudoviridinutans]GIJ87411.1 hypothetical protein Asppvi_006317 [Aspergillus pseudoviridinutans]